MSKRTTKDKMDKNAATNGMNKRMLTVIIKAIPVVSAILAILLVWMPFHNGMTDSFIGITFLLAGLGFVAFFIDRKSAKEDSLIRILGILDLISTFVIIAIYILVFFAIAMA